MTEDPFESYRPLLFSIAYRMLGSAMDAEDMVQETYLKWQDVTRSEIQSPRAYLVTIVTRLCINQLNSARLQREQYIGPWLPEPLMTEDGAVMPYTLESISMAFLVLLESLSPVERAVFLLREVFDYPYDEIAAIVGKSEDACRQLFSRAKKHIADHRPRFSSTPEEHDRLVDGFIQALEVGEVDGLARLLAEDVTVWTDGGGKVYAALRPVEGRATAATFLLGTRRLAPEGARWQVAQVNGKRALIVRAPGDTIVVVINLEIAGGLIRALHIVGNPDKLKKI
jgi:RNA polymerase sigma-70 factor (ECF subfamily)